MSEAKSKEKILLKKFLLINFGLTFLFGVFLFFAKRKELDLQNFAILQMYIPAFAAITTLLTSGIALERTTKRTYISYIIITGLMMINSIVGLWIDNFLITNLLVIITSIIFLVFIAREKQWKRKIANLNLYSLKSVLVVTGIFLIIYFLRVFLGLALEGDFDSFFNLFTGQKLIFVLMTLISFPLSFLPFFGEEYGWRYFLQPLLQKKFGMRKGLIFLGIIWGIWHLPLNLFFYAEEGSQLMSLVNQIFICIAYSIFFGYAYTKTKSIWSVVLIHYLNNNLILLFTDNFDPNIIQNQELTWKAVLISGGISLILFGIFVLSKYSKDRKYLIKTPLERMNDGKEEGDENEEI